MQVYLRETALYLKKSLPGLNVYVVGSSELGIVGVGESSTEHVMQFMHLMMELLIKK